MFLLTKKITLSLACLALVFSPVFSSINIAHAGNSSFMTDNGGNIISTALGCSGLLGKGSSKSGVGDAAGAMKEVPIKNATNDNKESCLDAIAYTAAKIVLAKITRSALDWINSGFKGSPTYVQEPKSFFGSIAKEQVSSFTAEIGFNPDNYPFGKQAARNIVNSIQNQLDYNAQVTSNNLLNNGGSQSNLPYKERFDNFTQDWLYGGGWNGYLAVTQISNTNPFNSYIQSVNSIGPVVQEAAEQESPIKQVTEELKQSGGFLALSKCVEPSDYEPESADTTFTREEATALSTSNIEDANSMHQQAQATEWLLRHTCRRKETKTPGIAIAEQMKISLGATQRQAELADELNESISSIFDALLKQLFTKGVASLSGDDVNPAGSNVNTLGGFGDNSGASTLGIGTGNNGQSAADQWYNQNKTFDLLAAIAPFGLNTVDQDLIDCHTSSTNPSAFIDDPNCVKDGFGSRGYLVVLSEYLSLIKEERGVVDEALRWLHELDYCVPGPRPDWYGRAIAAVQDNNTKMQEEYDKLKENETLSMIQGTLDPSGFTTYFNSSADDLARARRDQGYDFIIKFSGFVADKDGDDGDSDHDLKLPQNAANGLRQMLTTTDQNKQYPNHDGYRQKIDKRYNVTSNIPVELQILNIINTQEYKKVATFNNVMENITEDIDSVPSLIGKVKQIYNNLVDKQLQLQANQINQTQYDRYYDAQLRIFSGLVFNLKTEADIERAAAESTLAIGASEAVSDPTSGLIFECASNLPAIEAVHVFPYYGRRTYGDSRPSVGDYLHRGWLQSAIPPFINQTSETFLSDIYITGYGDNAFVIAHPDYIFIWNYMWENPNGGIDLNHNPMFENSIGSY